MSTVETTSRKMGTEAYDVEKVRREFPILRTKTEGRPLVYLDNAATTQKPRSVIDAEKTFYEQENANVHRGVYRLSQFAPPPRPPWRWR